MKRVTRTLLVLATATAACSPALAAGEKDGRFVLSSAVEPTHRTDNTANLATVMPSEKKDDVFAIGLEALKWVGATSRQVGVPYPNLWCADFINFVLRRSSSPAITATRFGKVRIRRAACSAT